jgi:hypothetical protein
MDEKILSSVPEIITAASKSPLGLIALAIIVVAAIALIFFKRDKGWYKIAVFGLVAGGLAVFIYGMLQVQREEAGREVAAAQSIRDLRLHLVFDSQAPVNPMHATVEPYIQRAGDSTERRLTENVQLIRGVGGLVVTFSRLTVGDRLFVVVEDHGLRWRSDDMRLPEAQLAMSAFAP